MSAHLKSTGLWLLLSLLLLASWPVMAGTVVTYYHLDAQGTPVAATDAAGTVLWRETHDPYGARHTRQSDVEADPLQYTGHAEERETGLVYLGSRVYDPSIGRFTGFDPAPVEAGEPRTFSRYGYAYNNPYGYADPGGESPVDVAFLAVDVLRLSLAIYSGNAAAIQSAAVDTAISAAGVLNPIPLSGQAAKAAVYASRSKAATEGVAAAKTAASGVGTGARGSGEAIHVTKSGVALPPGAKYQIPEGYVQNPNRSGSYGETVDAKFKERLRIDPPTPTGQKGPNYSHYHLDGKGTHYSPRPGDKDPGFGQ